VLGLDLARVERRLMAVNHLDAFGFERAEHPDLDHVDAVMNQRVLDLLGEVALRVHRRRDRALHGGDGRRDAVRDRRRRNALGGRRRGRRSEARPGRAPAALWNGGGNPPCSQSFAFMPQAALACGRLYFTSERQFRRR
jgi:hypothetical protein